MLFAGFLWSPVKEKWDNILQEINPVYKKTFYFDNWDYFSKLVLDIYKTDDINPKTVRNVKLKSMEKHEPSFVFYLFDIEDPKYRKKSKFNTNISTVVESKKKYLREKYSKFVKNYIHDIIIHIADNEDQTKEIIDLLLKEHVLNIYDYLTAIKEFNYALIKVETPYMTNNFPHNYPIGKDMDVIVSKEDYRPLVEITQKSFKNLPFFKITENNSPNNYRVRLEHNKKLHYQIDISCELDTVNIEELLANRKLRNNYYVLDSKNEFMIRKYELNKNPNKKHHQEWIDKYLANQ